MSGPPIFGRSPRLITQVPAPEVEIPAPSPRPQEPAASFSAVLLLILPTLAGALVMYLIGRGRGGSPWLYVGMMLPMMGISAAVQVLRMLGQRRSYERQMTEREQRYQQLLAGIAGQVQQAVDDQRRILADVDPDPQAAAQRARERSPRLWERSPADADFLAVRLGVGALPAAARVKAPHAPGAEEPDPLLAEALRLPERFARVDGVPIRAPLREAGVVGLVGPRPAVLETLRALLGHLAVHHAPDEAKLAAFFTTAEAGEWAWMRWLPHTWASAKRRMLAADPAGADRLASDLYDALQRRKINLQGSGGGGSGAAPGAPGAQSAAFSPWYTVVLSDLSLIEKEPLLPLLLREGAALGASTLVLAARKEELPKECRAIIAVDGSQGDLILTAPALAEHGFTPDRLSARAAEELARTLAPVRLNQLSASAEIPARVTLLDLLGIRRVEELNVAAAWNGAEPFRSLAVPLGLAAGSEPLLIDLHERAHGPHGLVAGATGSGKSELLQTLVAALACRFHPHDLSLVLVDYKGGGMANLFAGLPHLVGTITNLGGNLTRRALAALKAELRRRQRLLAEAGVNHVDSYMKLRRKGHALEPLPHLLLIVDEFAELKSDQPDFMRELVSAVRVGRSLGVHLILATQKPAGVIDEQIWSNARFRICLRVERPEDSKEVLKSPEAAFITGAGRAYFQVGNNERFDLFQAGWGGAIYEPDAPQGSAAAEIAEVGLDGARYAVGPRREVAPAADAQPQLSAVLAHLIHVAQEESVAALAGPWLPPLPEAVALASLLPPDEGYDGAATWRPASAWMTAPVGLLDDPEIPAQKPLLVDLGREGHLAVYGAPGSGKTTFLQSLVVSLAHRYSPADCQLYLVDGGGRTLTGLAGLPHVGAAMAGDETERIERLVRLLMQTLDERKAMLGEAGVNTLEAYRKTVTAAAAGGKTRATAASGQAAPPAVVVIIDSYPTFAQTYVEAEESLAQIAREGGSLGIHLVVTANTPGQIRSKVAGNITLAVALQMADRGDYSMVVGRTGGLEPMPVPGRGLVKAAPPLEFQTALPVEGETEWQRAAGLRELCERMKAAWTGPLPGPVRTLPEIVPLDEVLAAANGGGGPGAAGAGAPAGVVAQAGVTALDRTLGLAAPVALDVESLEPFAIPLADGPNFLVTGPAESGKTTLLQTWALSLAERCSPEQLQLFLIDMGAGGLAPLRRLPHVKAYVPDPPRADELLAQLTEAIGERRAVLEQARSEGREPPGPAEWQARFPTLVILIDDVDAFRSGASQALQDRLEQLVRRDRGLGIHLVVAGLSSVIGQLGYEGVVRALKESQTGVLLGSTDHTDLQFLNIRIPGDSGRLLPPGLGFYGRRGRWRRIKVATASGGGMRLAERVAGIEARWAATVETKADAANPAEVQS